MAVEKQLTQDELDILCINTIRTLSMDAVQRANSGHPGAPMGLAPVAYLLYDRCLRYNPKNPEWPNRDRFVLSAGHASMLLYAVLHLTGYGVSLRDIKRFRQLGSKCPGHPEYGCTPGVEMTTGPLGAGVATSVGMAIAERWLAAHFNRPGHEIVNYRIYAVNSDGCLMEGISSEAASLAGHLGLSNLTWIYDNNHITIEGNTDLAFSEDVAARFIAYDWNVCRVEDVNDLSLLGRALDAAARESARPTLIIADSHIAYGSPNKQDTSGAHGEPLGEEEIRLTKQRYGWPPGAQFLVPSEVKFYMGQAAVRGAKLEKQWNARFAAYARKYPKLAEEWNAMQAGKLPKGWNSEIPSFPADAAGLASREASHKVLNSIAKRVHYMIGGSADLMPSTKTRIEGGGHFQRDSHEGRNLHFGVREHSMGAVVNGIALAKLRAFGSSFLIFSDYARPSIRLSALMGLPATYVFTHDSIGVGEDGPTHQPIEHLASLRAIPGLVTLRPADANEVAEAWLYIMQRRKQPVVLVLSRQAIPTLDRKRYAPAAGLHRGAYVISDVKGKPDLILIASGSEVSLCLAAQDELRRQGVKARVVSMPSYEIYEAQPRKYRWSVLPPHVRKRLAVEAGSSLGWRRYVGLPPDGSVVALHEFGASAPRKDLQEKFGFTVKNIVTQARKLLAGKIVDRGGGPAEQA